MSVESILEALDREIANLTQARAVLAGGNGIGVKLGSNGSRTFSASARRKMAAAQKRRWAAFHAAGGKATARLTLVQSKPRRMSSAARKRIAAAQRARWAKLRASKAK